MANNVYVKRPGSNDTVTGTDTAQMQSSNVHAAGTGHADNAAKPAPQKEKKYKFLNVIIVIMTIILFFMAVSVVVSTAPKTNSFYEESTAEDLIRKMNYSGYQRLLEGKYENEALGVTAENKPALTVPYAIADYYEAAFNYRGYYGAGDPGAADYRKAMDEAKAKMGEYEYIADDIDEFMKIK